ncbi:trichohyalin-like [Papaver somniferum]|uniref:trichohyalin-like n=1 Tax=Papaver somniferum TaxID=3469 RepID=UPI000E6F5B91|nr:trichohyalin-like [Papaver somniferum]
MEEHQRTEILIGSQREQGQNNDIDYDRVSVHTAITNSTDEGQRIGNEEPITTSEGNVTIAELRQRLLIERKREEEERANLIRQNNDLREENLRLQEQRSRSNTRSRSRSSTSSSRQSQSNRRNDRRRQHMEVIEENSQENENLEDPRERRRIIDLATNRYEHPRELLGRAHINFEREEEDPGQGHMILHGREILRDEYERERETARARDRQRRREELEERELQSELRQLDYDNRVRKRERRHIDDAEQGRVIPQEREISRHRYDRTCNEERHDRVQIEANTERRRRRREEVEQQEIKEAIRQNNHENRLRQARLKRPMQEDLDQSLNKEIIKEMTELREMMIWENYDAMMCKYFAASLAGEALKWFEGLPVESIGSFSSFTKCLFGAGTQGRNNAEMEQKLVAMGSTDQAEFETSNFKIMEVHIQFNQEALQDIKHIITRKLKRIVWEQINFSKLNNTVDKVWEAALLMDDIP